MQVIPDLVGNLIVFEDGYIPVFAGEVYFPTVMSTNAFNRGNRDYSQRAFITRGMRDEAWKVATDWKNRVRFQTLLCCVLVVQVHRPTKQRLDLHNKHVKPYIDGFVDAGILQDDSSDCLKAVLMVEGEQGKDGVSFCFYRLAKLAEG